ncbi:Intermembrane phospholipid transport system binding protein MlaC [Gammaproteobacteria bacterium]|nr:ABC transporter substrate-binding protein [Gammaproteobacteria bacterium]QOJ31749.1 MAG: ABC transporter substrate-binding protein [Gammaproteobacteria bacterium]CAG0941964.1 Intermembrane phospholipid transport system binding protein MlaC [Gammaproteobacteria bacterium]
MKARSPLSSLAFALLATTGMAAAAASVPTAHEVVENAVTRIAHQLDSRRQELESNRKELYALVDRELLPQFDTDYAGRLVLGKAWRNATPEQRKRFVDAFYNFLLRSYSSAILKFDQHNIRILPERAPPQDGRTVVDTEMRMADGSTVPVSYAMHETPAGWKAFDVRIEGVSYIQNYRNQFNAEVAAKGLDALITRLERDTADIDAGKRDPDRPKAGAGGA